MNEQPQDVRIGVSLSQEQSVDLLRKLAEDNDFRNRLQSRPRDALAEYGIDVSDAVLPEAVALPTVEESQRYLEEIEGEDLFFVGRALFQVLCKILGGHY